MTDIPPHQLPKDTGWIEVITGCMFSGKTEELIRRLKRAQIAKQSVKIFKPRIDERYSKNSIVSHNDQSLPSILIDDIIEVLEYANDAQVIGIDEDLVVPNKSLSVYEGAIVCWKRNWVSGGWASDRL